jgi:hypothetical protein
MNRKCKKYRKDFVAYLDRELTEKDSASIAGHLLSCAACQKELDELRESMNVLSEWESITPSEGYDRVFWEKVKLVREDKEKKEEKRSFLHVFPLSFHPRFTMVTSAALVIFIFLITFFTLKPHREIPQKELYIAKDMELFLNMEIIEQSEALENFEVINLLDVLEQEVKG